MKKHGEEIWAWIDGGAYFYVCGDKSRMAKDVHKTLIGICGEHGACLKKTLMNSLKPE
jgi:sulfite reductase (NADPH) flavoprotein alpha-component